MLTQSQRTALDAIRAIAVPTFYLGLASLFWMVAVLMEDAFVNFGYYPVLQLRHFGFALVLVLMSFSLHVRIPLRYVGAGFAAGWVWLSSISYGIYVLHYPLLVQWSFAQTFVGLTIALVLLFFLAFLFDNRVNHLLRRRRVRR